MHRAPQDLYVIKSALTPKPSNNEIRSKFYMDMSLLPESDHPAKPIPKMLKFLKIKDLSWNLNFSTIKI